MMNTMLKSSLATLILSLTLGCQSTYQPMMMPMQPARAVYYPNLMQNNYYQPQQRPGTVMRRYSTENTAEETSASPKQIKNIQHLPVQKMILIERQGDTLRIKYTAAQSGLSLEGVAQETPAVDGGAAEHKLIPANDSKSLRQIQTDLQAQLFSPSSASQDRTLLQQVIQLLSGRAVKL